MLCAQPCGRSQRGSDPVETTRDLRIDPVFNPWEKPVEHWNTDMTYRKTYRKTNMTSETCRKNIWESSLFQDVSWIFDGHLETSCNVMETILMGLQFNSLGSMSVRMCCKELGNGKMGDFLPKSWSSQVEFSWPMFFFLTSIFLGDGVWLPGLYFVLTLLNIGLWSFWVSLRLAMKSFRRCWFSTSNSLLVTTLDRLEMPWICECNYGTLRNKPGIHISGFNPEQSMLQIRWSGLERTPT